MNRVLRRSNRGKVEAMRVRGRARECRDDARKALARRARARRTKPGLVVDARKIFPNDFDERLDFRPAVFIRRGAPTRRLNSY
tara:strand:- start:325 stop:573 length:249 start_codon:yes stop_codon:yes gene_type:complete|eukprot:24777-Pelagococcus_subviridis.AAC.2